MTWLTKLVAQPGNQFSKQESENNPARFRTLLLSMLTGSSTGSWIMSGGDSRALLLVWLSGTSATCDSATEGRVGAMVSNFPRWFIKVFRPPQLLVGAEQISKPVEAVNLLAVLALATVEVPLTVASAKTADFAGVGCVPKIHKLVRHRLSRRLLSVSATEQTFASNLKLTLDLEPGKENCRLKVCRITPKSLLPDFPARAPLPDSARHDENRGHSSHSSELAIRPNTVSTCWDFSAFIGSQYLPIND